MAFARSNQTQKQVLRELTMETLNKLSAHPELRVATYLELFRKSLPCGDARFVTQYARAFERRLARELAHEK